MLNSRELKNEVIPLNPDEPNFEELIDIVRNKKIVLIGESTHGTSEFYKIRAQITKELIEKCGFKAVAVEGDWPDIFRINRYVKGNSSDANPLEALGDIARFPLWMWRNKVVEDFVGWLNGYNKSRKDKAGFYGLDLYGIKNAISVVLSTVRERFPERFPAFLERYSCFQMPMEDAVNYGRSVAMEIQESCAPKAVEQLKAVRENFISFLDREEKEEFLNLEQNARTVVGAESYYRNLFSPGVSTWNIRDKHMFGTLRSIDEFLSENENGKIVIWAHNSHVGRAISTRRELTNETTLGELAADHYKDMCFSIGMTTSKGSVTAAHNWDEEGRFFHVNPPIEESYEHFFSQVKGDFMIPAEVLKELRRPLLERAIGVVYRPETERMSHYFESDLAARYDWIIHINNTCALEPLDDLHVWQPSLAGREKDLYPSAL